MPGIPERRREGAPDVRDAVRVGIVLDEQSIVVDETGDQARREAEEREQRGYEGRPSGHGVPTLLGRVTVPACV
jgi:hypothetical protein